MATPDKPTVRVYRTVGPGTMQLLAPAIGEVLFQQANPNSRFAAFRVTEEGFVTYRWYTIADTVSRIPTEAEAREAAQQYMLTVNERVSRDPRFKQQQIADLFPLAALRVESCLPVVGNRPGVISYWEVSAYVTLPLGRTLSGNARVQDAEIVLQLGGNYEVLGLRHQWRPIIRVENADLYNVFVQSTGDAVAPAVPAPPVLAYLSRAVPDGEAAPVQAVAFNGTPNLGVPQVVFRLLGSRPDLLPFYFGSSARGMWIPACEAALVSERIAKFSSFSTDPDDCTLPANIHFKGDGAVKLREFLCDIINPKKKRLYEPEIASIVRRLGVEETTILTITSDFKVWQEEYCVPVQPGENWSLIKAATKQIDPREYLIFYRPDESGDNWQLGCSPLFEELFHFDEAFRGRVPFKQVGSQFVRTVSLLDYEAPVKMRIILQIKHITLSLRREVPLTERVTQEVQGVEYYDQPTGFGWMKTQVMNIDDIAEFISKNPDAVHKVPRFLQPKANSNSAAAPPVRLRDDYLVQILSEGAYAELIK